MDIVATNEIQVGRIDRAQQHPDANLSRARFGDFGINNPYAVKALGQLINLD